MSSKPEEFLKAVAQEKGLGITNIWDSASAKVHAHVAGALILPSHGQWVQSGTGVEGSWVKTPAKHAPEPFVALLTHVIIDRFRAVVKGRMILPSQEYCGITWTEEYFLEALLLISQNNKGLLTYEKDGATVTLNPDQTAPEVANQCTILGVLAENVPAEYRFINPCKFRLDPKMSIKPSVKVLYEWLQKQKGEASLTGTPNHEGAGSMLSLFDSLMRSFVGKNVVEGKERRKEGQAVAKEQLKQAGDMEQLVKDVKVLTKRVTDLEERNDREKKRLRKIEEEFDTFKEKVLKTSEEAAPKKPEAPVEVFGKAPVFGGVQTKKV